MTQTIPAVSDAVFRALTESSPDGIVLVNQEGRIVLVNLHTEKLFCYDRDELPGQSAETLVPVMTDVVLPGSSGPKLAGRQATTRPEMKVLFVSGYTVDALVHGDLHRTDFAFLSKPFSLNTLARKIRTLLDA